MKACCVSNCYHNNPPMTHGLSGSVCAELVVKLLTDSVCIAVVVILLTGSVCIVVILLTGPVCVEVVVKLVVEHDRHTGWPPCIRLARSARRSKSSVRAGQEIPHSMQAASKRGSRSLAIWDSVKCSGSPGFPAMATGFSKGRKRREREREIYIYVYLL